MDTNHSKSPIQEPSKPLEIKLQNPNSSSEPTATQSVAPATAAPVTGAPAAVNNSKDIPTTAAKAAPPPSTSDAVDTVFIPSYSRWFSWNGIHDCETRFLPEFFDGKSPSKNPRVYKYYRNSIITRYRENSTAKISFTEARKSIIGDVGSVRRVFDFLEAWGLINYNGSTSKIPLKWDEKETKSSTASNSSNHVNEQAANPDFIATKKRLCSGCKSVCSIACFVSDKFGLTLCARCYVRGNYRVGVSSSDFKRVEINEEIKADWTDKETLHLLEAAMHYGDDWKKISEHVGGGRSERECVNRFIKLPFGEQFVAGHPDSVDDDADVIEDESPAKRMRFNPLADASNPIMAQAAFLSAIVGVNVAETTAQSAIAALSKEVNEKGCLKAMACIERDERDMERAISHITNVQMKEIQEKILKFEEVDLQMEKEWQQLHQMKNLLFADQLTLIFNKPATTTTTKIATTNNDVVTVTAAAANNGGGESSSSTKEEEEEEINAA
ncbi:SWI/SNF complex subunit SWI3B [Impatiens glandulifera]|uniref:SWI/SNF complex subunit SWI3B n=1 Tax=Impatiens glandulifera TaxID=253017 RepID=UPI001FB18D1E|nr:SWI/SNF complex subunit SWI3B [Impatiens glandulifera]